MCSLVIQFGTIRDEAIVGSGYVFSANPCKTYDLLDVLCSLVIRFGEIKAEAVVGSGYVFRANRWEKYDFWAILCSLVIRFGEKHDFCEKFML